MNSCKLVCLAGIVALCVIVAPPASAQWDPNIEGYSQFRYTYSDDAGDGDFDTRRVRIGWRDTVNDQGTEARFMIGLGDLLGNDEDEEVDLIYAWVSHPFDNGWTALLGFDSVKFGYDMPYSSSKRLPFERSMAANSFIPGVFALGAKASYQGEQTPLQFDLQVLDGVDAWHDSPALDDAESLVLRAQYPIDDRGLIGVSYMTSNIELAAAAGDVEPNVWGAHLLWDCGRFGFQGEYFDGDWADHTDQFNVHDADGWYALIDYTPEDSAVIPFYRYDEFDAGNVVDYSRHTLGVAWEPWDANRFTLQVEDIDMRTGDDTTIGLQWQVEYK